MANVLVFRTNINSADRLYWAACQLGRLPGNAYRWNVDMDDCDCVLRIETDRITENDVIALLTQGGLVCEPLE